MKVRMLTGIAGRGFAHAPGAVIELDDDEAVRWLNAGIAEPVEDEYRTATAGPPESAAKPRPQKRKKGGGK